MEQLSKVAFSDKFSTIKDENPTDRQNSVKKSCFAKQCTARSASYCNNGSDEPRECKLHQVTVILDQTSPESANSAKCCSVVYKHSGGLWRVKTYRIKLYFIILMEVAK